MRTSVPLSQLVASRRNPRRVKPEREAHRRLVASIRAHGLLEPLVVRPLENPNGFTHMVIAGNRRLAALRVIHRGDGDPRIPCEVRDVDNLTADAMSLAENFAREGMHPLDEAETFAKLAREDAKGVNAIAAEFGVTDRYVRQRMKLATLAEVVKAAYREGRIDTATAEVFATVPEERQEEVWKETGGQPRHAEQVRGIVANAWLDATHALFDPATLPEEAVSSDLFSQKVLIERSAFLQAQGEALAREREGLIDNGWSEVVVGPQADAQDRLWAMSEPSRSFDAAVTRKLDKLAQRREKLESLIEKTGEEDESALQRIEQRLEELDAREKELITEAPIQYAEETKAVGTVFLLIDPDGRIRREYRVPKHRRTAEGPNGNGAGTNSGAEVAKAPTSDDLSDNQLAAAFTHQALAVRQAVLDSAIVRKRLLVLALHDKVRKEALSVRHDANGTTLHADHSEGFRSSAWDELRKLRTKLDPFAADHSLSDDEAYERLTDLSAKQLDALIDLFTAESLTAHPTRSTPLIERLAGELAVDVRRTWTPDTTWLKGFQKIQLAHLIGELRGPIHGTEAQRQKKSELVESLARLFADADEGKIKDTTLAARVNDWLPSNLRQEATDPVAVDKAEAA